MNLYRNESSYPKVNAQRNLQGRTHYVDDDTLRFHKSRVLSARCTDGGLLFAIVTSDAADMNNTRRVYRYVIFDVFGTVLDRPNLEDGFKSSARAEKAMWAAINAMDAAAITTAAIERARLAYLSELHQLAIQVDKLVQENKTTRKTA
jgi:hypothetical protein